MTFDPSTVHAVLLVDGRWHEVSNGRIRQIDVGGPSGEDFYFIGTRPDGVGALMVPVDEVRAWVVPRIDDPARETGDDSDDAGAIEETPRRSGGRAARDAGG